VPDVFEVDLSEADEDNVNHAYLNLSALTRALIQVDGVTEAEIVSAIGDLLLDLSYAYGHNRMQ
jgi:hypothetical protein